MFLQDTVITLQAITGLAEQVYTPQFRASLTVTGNEGNVYRFNVDSSNSLVLQMEDVSIIQSILTYWFEIF